jgi:hypothetical protein
MYTAIAVHGILVIPKISILRTLCLSVCLSLSLSLSHTHTHTEIYVYVCVCLCITFGLGNLKMEITASSDTVLPIYRTKQAHNIDDSNFYSHSHVSLVFR